MRVTVNPVLLKITSRGILIGIALLFCWGCATSQDENYVVKEPKIFRRTWFDFYNQGRWLLQEGHFENAEKYFREALARYDTESWEERTYGVHFIEYFPHRELGIALYSQRRYQEAEEELLRSLEREDSSRAKFYLNQVRRWFVEKDDRDRDPPRIYFEKAYDGLITGDLSVTIRGRAEDDTLVSGVRVAGEPIFFELWSPHLEFEKSIPLQPGTNDVEVMVEDISGKKTRTQIRIVVDRQAPLLLVQEIKAEGGRLRVKADIEDPGGLKSARIGDVEISFQGETRYSFERDFACSENQDGIQFRIEDQTGNDLRGTLEVAERQRSARVDSPSYLLSGSERYPEEFFRPGVLLAFDPRIVQERTDEDSTPPVIALRSIDDSSNTVLLDRYYIEGRVQCDRQIHSLQVDGKELLRSTAKEVYFGEVVDLKNATNEFVITAQDDLNHVSRKRLRIVRVIPESLSIGTRLAVTLTPLDYLGQAQERTREFDDRLLQAFVNAARFRVLDPESLEAIMLERRLGTSVLADPSTAAHLGRLQNADLVLSGYVRPYPRTKGIEVVGRLVDTESSEVLFEQDVYGEQQEQYSLGMMLEGLYLKLARGFPLLQGQIVRVERKTLGVDLSYGAPARRGMPFLIYREGDKLIHPVSGRLLGVKTEVVGEAAADQVLGQSAVLKILELKSNAAVLPGDKVIAR